MLPCNECKQCNRIHKLSVMRGSAYCDSNRIDKPIFRKGFFTNLKEKIFLLLHPENKPVRKHGGFRFND